jgi:hypothetical protein
VNKSNKDKQVMNLKLGLKSIEMNLIHRVSNIVINSLEVSSGELQYCKYEDKQEIKMNLGNL